MGNQQLFDMVNVAKCRINLAICEATLAAMKAITTMPEMSGVVETHDDACIDAYWELQSAEHHAESGFEIGSEEEWEALSDTDKASNWEKFHGLCAQGIGDEMYFYRVLMNKFLVGYVGH